MIVYVTALITSPSQQKSRERYFELGAWLLQVGVPLWIYVDASLKSIAEEWTSRWPHVTLGGIVNLEDLEGMKGSEVRLPAHRNVAKDTREYLSIQNQKLGFLADVSSKVSSDVTHVGWIDFGIRHVLKDPERVASFLRDTGPKCPETKLWAPSAWPKTYKMSLDRVCWTFLGGFVVAPCSIIQEVWERQKTAMLEMRPRLTWEVNVWTLLLDQFDTFIADHNDSMILHA